MTSNTIPRHPTSVRPLTPNRYYSYLTSMRQAGRSRNHCRFGTFYDVRYIWYFPTESTLKYLKVPRSTLKYPRVLMSKVPQPHAELIPAMLRRVPCAPAQTSFRHYYRQDKSHNIGFNIEIRFLIARQY